MKELYLQPWQEVIGKCVQASSKEGDSIVVIEAEAKKHIFVVVLPDFQVDPQTLIGEKIAILKTDDPKRQFLIRKITTKNTMPEATNTTTPKEETK